MTRACVRGCVAQARRLESQLYQRAQDMRTIETSQRQAALARQQVRQLEQNHLEQAARISQGAKSLQRLQDLIRESIQSNNAALAVCEALQADTSELRGRLQRAAPEVWNSPYLITPTSTHFSPLSRCQHTNRVPRPCFSDDPQALASVVLKSDECVSVASLRARAASLEAALAETERSALQQIGVTPLTSVAMSCDCNPLNDLSAVADYASKASVGACSERPSEYDGAGAPAVGQQTVEPPPAPINLSVGVNVGGGGPNPMQMSPAAGGMSLLNGVGTAGLLGNGTPLQPRAAWPSAPAYGCAGLGGAPGAAASMLSHSPLSGLGGGLGMGAAQQSQMMQHHHQQQQAAAQQAAAQQAAAQQAAAQQAAAQQQSAFSVLNAAVSLRSPGGLHNRPV